ncbi:DUF6406 domain-containing protein [Streptomyces sp. NPDC101150]|uniref:DUF6406 domain-containing protein n=1 Tax=Streptomyces sp. NPDC101150 TaxID=3366114 RepID=UPI0037F4A22F
MASEQCRHDRSLARNPGPSGEGQVLGPRHLPGVRCLGHGSAGDRRRRGRADPHAARGGTFRVGDETWRLAELTGRPSEDAWIVVLRRAAAA